MAVPSAGQFAQNLIDLCLCFHIDPARRVGQEQAARPEREPLGQNDLLLIAT